MSHHDAVGSRERESWGSTLGSRIPSLWLEAAIRSAAPERRDRSAKGKALQWSPDPGPTVELADHSARLDTSSPVSFDTVAETLGVLSEARWRGIYSGSAPRSDRATGNPDYRGKPGKK